MRALGWTVAALNAVALLAVIGLGLAASDARTAAEEGNAAAAAHVERAGIQQRLASDIVSYALAVTRDGRVDDRVRSMLTNRLDARSAMTATDAEQAFVDHARDALAASMSGSLDQAAIGRLVSAAQRLEVEQLRTGERLARSAARAGEAATTLTRDWLRALFVSLTLLASSALGIALWARWSLLLPLRRVADAFINPDGATSARLFEAGRGDELGVVARALASAHSAELEREALSARVRHGARHDPLTGALNRLAFDEQLSQTIAAAARNRCEIALVWVDLDQFKVINDSFGHAIADMVLRDVADGLASACREGETLARVGGDEFAVIQVGVSQPDGAKNLAERLLAAARSRAVGDGNAVGLSAGVALFPHDALDERRLRHRVGVALYAAKANGGCIRFASDVVASRRSGGGGRPLLLDLPRAIEADNLCLHYQPKLDVKANRVDGLEALVRWQHPEHGLVRPSQFIPPAERLGQIRPLTDWTLRRAIEDQRRLAERALTTPVFVNISGGLLADSAFIESALDILGDRVGVIGLEITETDVISDPDRALGHLHRLVEAGLRISIDDYGTGMSSLSYLKQLPAHELKIDRVFISELARSQRDPLLVRSTIDLAHALGLQVTAEGVESLPALALLRAMGCDLVQGYLVAHPMPLARLMDFLVDPHNLDHLTLPNVLTPRLTGR